MVIVPQTPITEASFERWKSHRIDVSDENESYFYYIIPLIEVGEDEINDIEWSPLCSTLFASVAKDGRLELWDLKKMNMLDPFFKLTA